MRNRDLYGLAITSRQTRENRIPEGRTIALTAVLALIVAGCAARAAGEQAPIDTAAPTGGAYAAAAVEAADWIRSTAITSENGTAWPADPYDTATVVTQHIPR